MQTLKIHARVKSYSTQVSWEQQVKYIGYWQASKVPTCPEQSTAGILDVDKRPTLPSRRPQPELLAQITIFFGYVCTLLINKIKFWLVIKLIVDGNIIVTTMNIIFTNYNRISYVWNAILNSYSSKSLYKYSLLTTVSVKRRYLQRLWMYRLGIITHRDWIIDICHWV